MDASLNGPFGRLSLTSGVLTIGRLPSNTLALNDVKASSRHAELRPANDAYAITDLGSTNGTFVNEQQLRPNEPRQLNAGDTVRIGDTRFTYEVSGTPQIDPTVYAEKDATPGYDPTIAVPPPAPSANTVYSGDQQYAQNPPPPAPAYGQPGAYPPPPTYAQPQPAPPYGYSPTVAAKKSNKTLFIVLGSVVGGIILLCILASVIVYATRSTPEKTLTTYCDSIKSGDYQTAYNQLSRTIQNQETETQFASALTSGSVKITGCSASNVRDDGVIGTGTLSYTTSVNIPVTGDCRLAQENSVWKITNQTVRQQ